MKQKQIILIISLLCLFFNGSNAQTQFPDKNGEWYLKYRNPESKSYSQNPFYIEKDTIINELKYSIMKLDDEYPDNVIRAAIRNDNKKVFYIDLNKSEKKEFLLYDFGLEMGDSIELKFFRYGREIETSFWKIVDIDYIDINGGSRKVIELTSRLSYIGTHVIWIEGIGSTMGPLYPIIGSRFEEIYELNCYKEKGIRIWGGCSFIDSKQEIKKPVDCYYERSQKQLIIHNFQKDYNLTIHNYLGKLVFSTSNCLDETIDLSWLGKGIYIYTLNFEEQSNSKKFIVEP